jgi:hypothetical protein
VVGCARSRRAAGGKKGRGFGARKDKCDEHVRIVHGKAKGKGGKVDRGEEDDVGEVS